jgi:glucose/arabinose dehydrogenase/regulation of enolase protein 1 (concanavalin A-like superfamily)
MPPSAFPPHKTLALTASLLALTLAYGGGVTRAQTPIPTGFADSVVLTGLQMPTAVAFAPDGRVFVAEKSGLIKVFDSLSDPSPSVFADLRTQVFNYLDRGMLGLALDPGFPNRPYVYVLYTRDAPIGGTAPRWGTPGATSDFCPDPPGMDDGCVASGRLSRLEAAGNVWTGTERVLVDDWFQQFDSHSLGSLAFGPDGALYASGGDAASWQFVDYGQRGEPPNPGGDPPVPVGGTQTPPTAEGGALRSQDLRTEGDPVGLNGTVIRIDPDTAAAMPDNPLYAHPDPNAKRIIAYGLRNPFRIALRPGTREVWVGDVGWRLYEELNVIPDPSAGVVRNFGWPCYDGTAKQDGYDAADLDICEKLYAEPSAVTFAHFQYREGVRVVASETCGFSDSSTTGLAFYQGGSYPAEYNGALFFADYTRRCIWVMPPDINGMPDPARRATFITNAAHPVDLKIGPGGDLYYVDITGGAIRRIRYTAGNQPPTARVTATPQSGPAPLAVSFDGDGSTDPEGGALTYSWDLNGDGTFGDATVPNPSHTYSADGTYVASVRVTDDAGLQDVAATTIVVGNTAPTAVIDTPAPTLRWRVGQSYSFSGHATDQEDGAVPASRLTWSLILNHCSTETSCHEHFVQEYRGVSSGTFSGADHEYPSYLTLRLTATDAGGLQHTVSRRLDPQSVVLSFDTRPSGLEVTVGGTAFRTPASRTAIVGSSNTVSAPSPQTLSGTTYTFASWSDGGAQTHLVTAGETPVTFTATYNAAASTLPSGWSARDVGAVGVAGSSSHSGGTFTIRGAGADVWGTADAFQYAYQSLTGDGAIVARVASVQGAHAWTKVGVMIRETSAADSAHAFMLVSTSKGLAFQRRTAAGALSTSTSGALGTAPKWVRLTRAGTTITAAYSSDGAAWTTAGSDTFSMAATVLVGLAVTSHDASQLATGTIDNVTITSAAPQPGGAGDIVLYAAKAPARSGAWNVVGDPTAAGGARMSHPDAGAARVTAALASPANYFDMTFTAQAGTAHRLWIRGRADANHWANDSVFVQFSGSVTSAGAPQWRMGTTSATEVLLEDCSGCGLAGWGWQDNAYPAGVAAPLVYFAAAGTQTIRIQTREDGLSIDQIVLSPATFLSSSPGALKNDTTILAEQNGGGSPPPPPPSGDVVLYAAEAPVRAGNWTVVAESTAAGGSRLRNPDAGAAKLTTASAAPADYFEMTFAAEAGKAYRLWIRLKADNNHWGNDSVFVQFSGSVSSSGAAQWRIGSSSSAEVNLEDCVSCGISGWGWQDNGYGAGVLGPLVYFAATGSQKIRIQPREDGASIDQIVLSSSTYSSSSPGALKNDTTILQKQ